MPKKQFLGDRVRTHVDIPGNQVSHDVVEVKGAVKKPRRGGRPLKFKSVQGLQKIINIYFQESDNKKKPYTISGLALALGVDRKVLLDYESGSRDKYWEELTGESEGYSRAIKAAKNRIAAQWEQKTFTRGNAGDIFMLKNLGFKDRTEVETHLGGNVAFINVLPRPKQYIDGEEVQEGIEAPEKGSD